MEKLRAVAVHREMLYHRIPMYDATVQALMEEAARYLGYPYVWGGSSPSTSFDCSGFVCWVFTNSGVHNLPRTTAQGIYDQCTPVSAADAKGRGHYLFYRYLQFTGTCQPCRYLLRETV